MMIHRHRHILQILLFSFSFAGCEGFLFFKERDDFVKVRGTQFIHNDKPYYFTGSNLWYGMYLGSSGESGDRKRLLLELDSLKAIGLINLRILAASETSYLKHTVTPVLQSQPGILNDSLLEGLDFILNEMRRRKMKAVLYLNNYWEWSGGMAQYMVWADSVSGVNPDDTTQGWGAYMDFSAKFYESEKANRIYRNCIKTIVRRKNNCNGRYYYEDPTIMAWQLANEPRPGTVSKKGNYNLPAFYRWIDKTAEYIHSIDTNHLVSSGSEGSVGSLLSEENFIAAHKTKQIDYLTMHLWPFNWQWFNPKKIDETLPETESKGIDYINAHIVLARNLNKPIVLEEFGLTRDNADIRADKPAAARDHFYRTILKVMYDSARAGAPVAGSNFWGWGGLGRGKNEDGYWRKGDPYTADPPQEPQGLNSVFDTDTSTIAILREYAEKCRKLGGEDSVQKLRITN